MFEITVILVIFVLGLVIGSFLNVLIFRLHSGDAVCRGRSQCPQCGHILRWADLFPVFSFICLDRKCRYCQAKISWQYPTVELVTGVLFVAAFVFDIKFPIDFPSILALLRDWIVIASLIVIFVYDLRWLIIPDQVVLPALAVVIVLNLLLGIPLGVMAVGLAVGLGFFGLQYAVSRGTWIGGGDLRLGALMGAFLGWPLIVVALFLSYSGGAMTAVILLAQKKVTAKSQVPFGVFLVPATIFALFWGRIILAWYWGRLN